MVETYEENLKHFTVVKRTDNKAQCKCPAHDDKTASLTISKGEKKTIFHCHAGCEISNVLSAAGLKLEETYYNPLNKKETDAWRYYVEKRESKKIEAVYHYHNIFNGNYCFTKLRLTGKHIIYGIFENNRFKYGLPRSTPRKSLMAVYGDLNALNKTVKEKGIVFIVEGEKDVDTLKKRGYAVFTYGGINDWQDDFADVLIGAKVYILADNDKPGISVANKIKNSCSVRNIFSKIVIPTPEIEKGDITDYFNEGHSNEDFEALLSPVSRINIKKKMSIIEQLEYLEAYKKYETNDKGYGALYAEIFKDKHRYNPSIKDFMLYDGKKWVEDPESLSAKADAKALSDAILVYAANVASIDGDRSGYLKAVTSLCNIRNRNNMLQDSKDIYYFTNETLDQNDYLLNLQNGTLDLSGVKPVFMEHSPDLLLSKICNVNYVPDAECKEWEKFLNEIMKGDTDKVKYLQKIAGLSLTGNTEQETCFILYGSTTRNGKSTFCETLIYLLNDYAITMKPESLAIKQNLDSRQASGDIARLSGCRFCNASEPPKRMLFDTALLKSLLGRDSITARHLHQREFSFIPKFKLIINTNYLPTITDDTVFSSGRINVISFDRHFEPHEQDKKLKEKLRKDRELSGILNWCIEGLYLYRKEGLTPPEAVKKSTEIYRNDSDKIGNFINECLVRSDKNSKAKDIYDLYSKWCCDNGYGTENKGNFFSELKNKNIFSTIGTVDGKTVKNIVKGYIIEPDFIEIKPGEQTPFD